MSKRITWSEEDLLAMSREIFEKRAYGFLHHLVLDACIRILKARNFPGCETLDTSGDDLLLYVNSAYAWPRTIARWRLREGR